MSKGMHIGAGGVARKIKAAYIGVGGVARKIKAAYIGAGGVARLCYTSGPDVINMQIAYTGNKTDEIVTMSGVQYRLLTLTSSGTLTIPEEVHGDVWMCGGGTSGARGGNGGSGAYCAEEQGITISGNTVCVVGAGGVWINKSYNGLTLGTVGSASTFGSYSCRATVETLSNYPEYRNGGSGGGSGGGMGHTSPGVGDGISKYPFGETELFYPHCGGGGGGSYRTSSRRYTGGDGGTNGGDGGDRIQGAQASGAGGYYGGGGGNADATYYGGGGGGGSENTTGANDGKNGYQGVVYVRIPVEQ